MKKIFAIESCFDHGANTCVFDTGRLPRARRNTLKYLLGQSRKGQRFRKHETMPGFAHRP